MLGVPSQASGGSLWLACAWCGGSSQHSALGAATPRPQLTAEDSDSRSSRVCSAGPRGESMPMTPLLKQNAHDKRVTDESPALPYAAPFEHVLMSSNRKPGVRTLGGPPASWRSSETLAVGALCAGLVAGWMAPFMSPPERKLAGGV